MRIVERKEVIKNEDTCIMVPINLNEDASTRW